VGRAQAERRHHRGGGSAAIPSTASAWRAHQQRPGRGPPEYWVERRFGPALRPFASLLGAKLGTGRTHQVRVHFAHLGCPVVGDPVYGRKARNADAPASLRSFERQALHAAILSSAILEPEGNALRHKNCLKISGSWCLN